MTSTIQELLAKYDEIKLAINDRGFRNAVIFRGFCPREEHNLNMLIEDKFAFDAQSKPVTHRQLFLGDDLKRLLNCNIVLNTPDEIDPDYQEMLNETNSVLLTDIVPTEAIKRVFGDDWTFNPLPILAPYGSDSAFKKDVKKTSSYARSKNGWAPHMDFSSLSWGATTARRTQQKESVVRKSSLLEKLKNEYAESQKIYDSPCVDNFFEQLKIDFKEYIGYQGEESRSSPVQCPS